jgi:hypothetical protein
MGYAAMRHLELSISPPEGCQRSYYKGFMSFQDEAVKLTSRVEPTSNGNPFPVDVALFLPIPSRLKCTRPIFSPQSPPSIIPIQSIRPQLQAFQVNMSNSLYRSSR